MTAKDKQKEIIKTYLKPKLKDEGFRTSGQTWWKFKIDFFILINLQNSQWNTKDELSFCFNIGIGLTEKLKDGKNEKPSYFDLTTDLREDAYLSTKRNNQKYRKDGWLGYRLTNKTDLSDFKSELKKDFEEDILPKLNSLGSLEDCLEFYGQFDDEGQRLQSQLDKL